MGAAGCGPGRWWSGGLWLGCGESFGRLKLNGHVQMPQAIVGLTLFLFWRLVT